MSTEPPDKMPIALLAIIIVPPLLAAMASVPLILFWIMGLSAFSGTEKALAANVGLWALIVYLPAYAVLALGVVVSAAFKWPLTGLFHTLIWMCLLALIIVLAWSFSELGGII